MTEVDDLLGRAPRARDLAATAIGSSLVVYDEDREQAHLLNHSAAAVWRECDGVTSTAEIIDRISQAFDVGPAVVHDDVVAVVAELAAGHLVVLSGFDAPPEPEPPTPWPPQPPVGYQDDRTWRVSSGPYRALGSQLWLQATDDRDLVASVTRALAPLLAPADEADGSPDQPGWTYRIWPSPSHPDLVEIATEHESLVTDAPPATAVHTLLWHVNHELIARDQDHLLLHSSAVSTDRGVLLLPAVANSGKSTLATGLVRAGYRYVTDEAVALRPRGGLVDPYPKPIGLDPGSFPLFADLAPAAGDRAATLVEDKWWLDPRRISPHGSAGVETIARPVHAIVFPTFDPSAPSRLEPVEPAEGVILLARNAFNLRRWGQEGLDLLASIATTVPMYRMAHGDLTTSVSLLTELVGEPASEVGAAR